MESIFDIFNFGKTVDKDKFKSTESSYPHDNFENAFKASDSRDLYGICPIKSFRAEIPLPLYTINTEEFNEIYISLKTHMRILAKKIEDSLARHEPIYGICASCTFQREFFKTFYDRNTDVIPQLEHFIGFRYLENFLQVAIDIIKRIKDCIAHAKQYTHKKHDDVNIKYIGREALGYTKQIERHIMIMKKRHDYIMDKELEKKPFQEWNEKIMGFL
jgi:hypothetical protein